MDLPKGYTLVTVGTGEMPVHIMSQWDVLCEPVLKEQGWSALRQTHREEPMCQKCSLEMTRRIMEDRVHEDDLCKRTGHVWEGGICLRCGFDPS